MGFQRRRKLVVHSKATWNSIIIGCDNDLLDMELVPQNPELMQDICGTRGRSVVFVKLMYQAYSFTMIFFYYKYDDFVWIFHLYGLNVSVIVYIYIYIYDYRLKLFYDGFPGQQGDNLSCCEPMIFI